jgi:hypothetical protein
MRLSACVGYRAAYRKRIGRDHSRSGEDRPGVVPCLAVRDVGVWNRDRNQLRSPNPTAIPPAHESDPAGAGDVGVTVDVDVVPDRADENLEPLARALRSLGARTQTEGDPEGLPFDCSAEFFRNLSPDSIVNMTTEAGDLDVTFQPSGTQGFADLRRDAVEIDVADQLFILVASLCIRQTSGVSAYPAK